MPAAKKKPATKKKAAATKAAPTVAFPAASPAGPDPVVLVYQLECKTAEAKALQIDKDRLQAEVHGLQTQLKEEQSWHEAMLRDITRQHKGRAEK